MLRLLIIALIFACFTTVAYSLQYKSYSIRSKKVLAPTHSSTLLYSSLPLDDITRDKIESIINTNKVVLFMKGNKEMPQCGFSNNACRILNVLNTNYETVNVLEDMNIRNGIKAYSSWPTIPQLYVGGEFVGGSDIMMEMYESGELAEMIELAKAK